MLKDLDGSPLCHKFAYEHQTVVEGHGHFAQRLLPWSMGYDGCSANGVLAFEWDW